jgi:hypothetical protein
MEGHSLINNNTRIMAGLRKRVADQDRAIIEIASLAKDLVVERTSDGSMVICKESDYEILVDKINTQLKIQLGVQDVRKVIR